MSIGCRQSGSSAPSGPICLPRRVTGVDEPSADGVLCVVRVSCSDDRGRKRKRMMRLVVGVKEG